MAFKKKQQMETKSIRITGLFKSKTRRGLFVGTARPDDIKALGKKMREALDSDKGLVFFLWKNDDAEEGQPVYNLTADVARDKPAKAAVKVEADEPEADDDLPF